MPMQPVTISRLQLGFLILAAILLWYGILHLISRLAFHVSIEPAAVPQDLAANLLLALACLGCSRNRRIGILSAILLMAALHLSNAAKMAILGGPIMPDDFLALKNLFFLFQGWQLYGTATVVALPLLLLLLGTAWLAPRTWAVFTLLLVPTAFITLQPAMASHFFDQRFGNSVWNQRGNFQERGLLIHLLQETTRQLARKTSPPSAEEVDRALNHLERPGVPVIPAAVPTPTRNVHMIVLESFWDPMLLTKAGLEPDPLAPAFRRLWQDTGESHALSPVFGGYTANAEFEALCGFPVSESMVFFESGLTNDVPCLPQVLHDTGYRSIASHPNMAAFWNRVNCYRRIGFDTYWADRDFVLDDLNGDEFLGDDSFYRQVLDKIEPLLDEGRPVFNYVLTFFGHLPYPLNERRPNRVTGTTTNGLIKAYANTMYYKSRELMDFIDRLRERDPDGLIILFGDHLPFLGPNFHGFTQNGLLPDSRDRLDVHQAYAMATTPLVIIDGRSGPLAVGDVPLYRLPAMIMSLLGRQEPTMFALTTPPDHALVRPLPGMHYRALGTNRALCREELADPACNASSQWLTDISVLSRDIFAGRQLALPKLGLKTASRLLDR